MGYTPFKMKGFSGFGNSPAKQRAKSSWDFDQTGVKTSYNIGEDKFIDENFKTAVDNTTITASPGISISKRGKGIFKAGPKATIRPANLDTSFGGRASYEFGKGSQQNYSGGKGFKGGFSGKVSGDFDTKSGGSAKVNVGIKNVGGKVCKGIFQGGVCKTKTKGVSLFGEHSFKDKSTSVGVQGRWGKLNVGGSYNLKTKTPSINLGYTFGT